MITLPNALRGSVAFRLAALLLALGLAAGCEASGHYEGENVTVDFNTNPDGSVTTNEDGQATGGTGP